MIAKITTLGIAFVLYLSTAVQAQSVTGYLNQNKADVTTSIKKGGILNKDFFNHQVFLLGEIHGVQKPQEVDLNLLALLNKEASVRTYIAEIDFAKAYLLNQYLKTDNESLIDTVFADWDKQNAQWANKEFQQKIRNIRKLNQTLPAGKTISFVGIDQVHNPALAARYFDEILTSHNLKTLKPRFEKLITLLLTPKADSLVANEARQLLNQLNTENNQGFYRPSYNQVVFGLEVCAAMTTKSREKVIYNNFKYLYKQLNWSKEKVYGFWGFFHVLQSKTNGGKGQSFTNALLNDADLNLKGKIVSMACLYSGSKMMMPTASLPQMWAEKGKRYSAVNQFNNDGPLMNVSNLIPFKEVCQPNTATLFKLDGADSPFLTEKADIKYNAFMPRDQQIMLNEDGKFMADYFQYLILIRNSEATTPINN
ncbi:erythromycin esterase family protein [Mucilaginibacter galii]|uniref:Erythromycin esterase family protein n=1 Tax=Mucilaginibacter galii TaxID=2005073 RepID=A0A917J8S9_9SPHI|nr:erythromycin esterase family protein [Mucilaginibacter galii]GGI49980.1 hypothetical protein GCM10011425_11920 [Mucilaginibacter galii]